MTMKDYNELMNGIEQSSNSELETLITLCIGRVLRLGSRPEQSGDIEQYEQCRWLAIHADEELKSRNAVRA